ncbi:mechanosensitive ion channel family protein [Salinibacterium sp. NSLL150]|uniref:mechanosensitive ion channel family protein n=1 Tax=unclassified Salinibacterium TaxID=2632331 RepID=UPI0018CECEA3|nr:MULTISPECIES: mechanosensitive ion channel family protein [unclassified Salinibacterium]MBH0097994.1 mechanosensitive ion channel family protein [Salinibacterium sp. NSLL35]MBH0100749.1 mechanosensitive ion channel family protein [Salinibacterium sp. NSLL150]MBH0103508.1 mechanosensitive ion channel family protein [Salinibacterium sp. NSLL16]MBH0106269.1 mechanosensitive ion channel family protein [Salinibacterium sp. NSLL17]
MFEWVSWLGLAVAVVIALVAVVIAVGVISLIVRGIARLRPGVYATLAPTRRRLRVLMALLAVWAAISITLPVESMRDVIDGVLLVLVIATSGWVLIAVINLLLNRTLTRYPTDVPDNRAARRIRTQIQLIRRILGAVIIIVTIGAILLTLPGAEALGASVLASAGLVSVVAGIAAQSALANVFAGMQLAFSDAIRVDDVVIADGEWGRIEEITLTYIVVSIWDQRRLVLPSTYFTTTPFQNWTRNATELLGEINFDLDWRVNIDQMRVHLKKIVAESDLWDGRTANIQVVDATGGFVRVRVLISAADSGAQWDLRTHVREEMVGWLQQKDSAALPRTRVLMVDNEARGRTKGSVEPQERGLFSGSAEADARRQEFTGAIPVQDNVPENLVGPEETDADEAQTSTAKRVIND